MEAKIKLVKEHPIPKTQQHVRQFLGLCNYYRKFVKNYSKIAVPMNVLLQKDKPFSWTAECQKSFETLQNALTTAPILAFPDLSKSFTLTCDASGSAIGYILGQVDENKRERVISYGGRALKNEEKNWTISEKECLAVLEGIKQHKVYLSNNKFKVFTDHKALIWLHKSKDTNYKLGRWALQLQDFDFEIIYKEGKNNQNADSNS
ncbi:Retrovirus-related Pol polyprotein from transposon 17.6 [Mytilus coruscus]|uniref:Retrovirus-related Pol polyprotein from transposon 17.6 n=1 Tax=Mytilus coruscus TaxID=42192 RepID=A0A6J8EDD1_MYTCO|nr:Retrovirus-related Pol polyprotein from transposon 17.6 [Mytilus coruscus]